MIEIINQLKAAYPSKNIELCIEKDSNEVFWVDEDGISGKSIISRKFNNTNDEERLLKIVNSYKKEINLLCIDSCIFSSADENRCDCALFDDSKFCFCELKFNVVSSRNAANNLASARNKQLDNTITTFKSQIDFSMFEKIEAYVAMRKTLYPRKPARLSELKLNFWNKHQVEYFEENEITFNTLKKK